jgi:hypothetical protein
MGWQASAPEQLDNPIIAPNGLNDNEEFWREPTKRRMLFHQ